MHSEATTAHANISMCGTSQDNEMTDEICMVRKLAKAAAELIRHLFHLKKRCGWLLFLYSSLPRGVMEITLGARSCFPSLYV